MHKSQLASDRTSCRDPRANQFRLILHTAAYWLMLAMRNAAPKRSLVRTSEFATIALRLIKIAARVVEGAARIRVFLPTACPDRDVFRALAGRFCAAGPLASRRCRRDPSPSSKPPTKNLNRRELRRHRVTRLTRRARLPKVAPSVRTYAILGE